MFNIVHCSDSLGMTGRVQGLRKSHHQKRKMSTKSKETPEYVVVEMRIQAEAARSYGELAAAAIKLAAKKKVNVKFYWSAAEYEVRFNDLHGCVKLVDADPVKPDKRSS